MNSLELAQHGWGRVPVEVSHCYRPEKIQQAKSICLESKNIIPFGLGRSYGDAALNLDCDTMLTRRLKRFLSFDPTSGVLTCEAGVSLEEIINFALPKGYFLPVTPGTKFVTLGGAVAADVHGKNHHQDGCISNFISELELMTADGEIMICSPEENSEVFWATISGMGLTGIILRISIKLLPIETAYLRVTHKKASDLDTILALFESHADTHRYSVAWIDCLASGKNIGRSVLMLGDHAELNDLKSQLQKSPFKPRLKRKKNIPFNFPSFALSKLSVKAFNKLFYWKHSESTHVIDYDQYFYPLDSINNWNRMYGKRGFIQYQCVVPWKTGAQAIQKLLEKLASSGRASFLAVLKAFGDQGSGLLSFPMPGLTLALDIPNDKGLQEFLIELDEIVLENDGRLYLAKDSFMRKDDFSQMYPKLPEFIDIKNRIDPLNKFQSSQARRLGIIKS